MPRRAARLEAVAQRLGALYAGDAAVQIASLLPSRRRAREGQVKALPPRAAVPELRAIQQRPAPAPRRNSFALSGVRGTGWEPAATGVPLELRNEEMRVAVQWARSRSGERSRVG